MHITQYLPSAVLDVEPVAWQYKGTSLTCLHYKAGYEPAGEGWAPLYPASAIQQAVAAERERIIDAACDAVAFNGGTVQLEAHIRGLK